MKINNPNPTNADAISNNTANQLPPFYNNTNSVEILYARIESIDSGCSSVNPFQIEVLVAVYLLLLTLSLKDYLSDLN